MEISRRNFFGVSALAMMVPLPPGAKARLTFGIMTDSHVGSIWMQGVNSPAVVKGLRLFDRAGCDAVVFCGDMVDAGLEKQLRHFASLWEQVFPKNGRRVEKVFVTGNHEYALWKPLDKQGPEYIMPQVKTLWPELFGEPWQEVFAKEVNGFQFVGAHWTHSTEEETAAFIEKAAAKTKPGDPFFYVAHAPATRTCFGSWPDEGDGSCGTTAWKNLEKHSNAVAFSGHTHHALTHPRCIWQGKYTAIHGGIMAWSGYKSYSWPKDLPAASLYGKYALLARVYEDRMVFERWDVLRQEKVPGDWTIPLPLEPATFPYKYETLLARAQHPEWPAGARVEVDKSMDENTLFHYPPSRRANTGKGGILLSFPSAVVPDDDLITYYMIEVYRANNDEFLLRKVHISDFYLGKDMIRPRNMFVVEAAEIPQGVPLRYKVTPVSAYCKKGPMLVSEPIAWNEVDPLIW